MLADGAAFVVRLKDRRAKPGVPRCVLPDLPASSRHGFAESVGGWPRRESHGVQDVLVDRWRKVVGQDLVSSAGYDFRMAAQQIVDIPPESARDPEAPRFADADSAARPVDSCDSSGISHRRSSFRNLPNG